VSAGALTPGIEEFSLFSEENQKALLGLSDEQRATAGAAFGAVAAKSGATGEDFLNAVAEARAIVKGLVFRRMLDRMLICGPKMESLTTAQASTATRRWAQRIELFFASRGDINSVSWERPLFFDTAALIVRTTH
jgi:hypothetical protein